MVDNLAKQTNKSYNLKTGNRKIPKYNNNLQNLGGFVVTLKKHTHINKKKQNKQYNKPSSFSLALSKMVALRNNPAPVSEWLKRKEKQMLFLASWRCFFCFFFVASFYGVTYLLNKQTNKPTNIFVKGYPKE